jgi:hypothetical protein
VSRTVTERDLRKPEFADANVEDYEFREDGAVVRKDRWMTGMRNVASIVVGARAKYEIDDVVEAVHKLKGDWSLASPDEDPEFERIDARLSCGSVLAGLERVNGGFAYHWQFGGISFTHVDFGADIVEWQRAFAAETGRAIP